MSYTSLFYSGQPRRMERKRLDRRRLEAAHFKFAVLCVTSWYSCDIKQSPVFSSDHQQDLLKFTPIYQEAFHKKYSGMTHTTKHAVHHVN